GMIGVHVMHQHGIVNLHIRGGSFGGTVIGALIFGAGFGLLGYCPGTAAGAVGHGAMDALIGGVGGLLFGSWLFAVQSPRLEAILSTGTFQKERLQEVLHMSTWPTVTITVALIVALLAGLEWLGL
ncbi:MAG: YeeE/YedE thiosulfate transporter family protein, partial [Chloroflexota bacterium]